MKRTAVFDIHQLIQAIHGQVGHLLNHERGWYAGDATVPTFFARRHYFFATSSDILAAQLTGEAMKLAALPVRADGLVDLSQMTSSDPIWIFDEERQFKFKWDGRDLVRHHWSSAPRISPTAYLLADAMITDTIAARSVTKISHKARDFEQFFNHDLLMQELVSPTSKYFRLERTPEPGELTDRHLREAIKALVTRLFELNDSEILKVLHFIGEGRPDARYDFLRSGTSVFVRELPSQMEECWEQWERRGILSQVIEFADKLVNEQDSDVGAIRSLRG